MAMTYEIDKERQLVISTASQLVSFAEVIAHQDGLLSDPDFDPQFSQFLDGTGVTGLDISIEQAKTFARRQVFSSGSRRAWVSPNPAIFGMGRLIAAYHELSPSATQVHVFRDSSSAWKWLGFEADPR